MNSQICAAMNGKRDEGAGEEGDLDVGEERLGEAGVDHPPAGLPLIDVGQRLDQEFEDMRRRTHSR